MAQLSKFLFETDFADPDAGRPNVVEETEIEAPVFSEEELLSAREHGYEAGIAAGQAQALASIEKRVGELIANLAGQMDGVAEQIAAQKALAAEDVAVLASAIATKVSGTKSDRSRLDLLERMITDCMAKLYNAPEVTAHVAPEIEADLTALLAMSDLTITVTVLPDPALSGTDCRLRWHGGGAERIEARIWQEVESLLEHYVGDTSVPDTNADDAETNTQTEDEAPEQDDPVANEAAPIDQGLDPADYRLGAETDTSRIDSILEQDDGLPSETAPETKMDDSDDLDLEDITESAGDAVPAAVDDGGEFGADVPRSAADLEAVFDIPVQVSAVLGKASMQVSQLLRLGRGAVVELDRKVGEAIDIYVNNRLVARGEVVVVEERLGVTMTEIIKTDRF